jgi:heme exporter protein C
MTWRDWVGNGAVAALVAIAIVAVCLVAPTEETMGHAQRILYVHVGAAWFALVAVPVMAGAGLAYLARRDLAWDHWAQAAAELGWLSCGLALVSGSVWARAAWGAWWTWDPRLTTTLVLWLIYSGGLVFRASLGDAHRRARLGAVLAVLAILDLPLVVLSARWFRGMHPASPQMAPAMRAVLLLSIAGFFALFAMLLLRRRAQLRRRGHVFRPHLLGVGGPFRANRAAISLLADREKAPRPLGHATREVYPGVFAGSFFAGGERTRL